MQCGKIFKTLLIFLREKFILISTMDYLLNFAETLSFLMKEAEINESKLAESLHTDAATISRYLHAEYAPSLSSFIALADFFGCSTDYLLGRKTEYRNIGYKPCPAFSVQLTKLLKSCKEKGISGKKLCEDNEISESSLYDWKAGRRQPSLANVIKLAEYLDCSLDLLLGREI